jgi:hypothetical protein
MNKKQITGSVLVLGVMLLVLGFLLMKQAPEPGMPQIPPPPTTPVTIGYIQTYDYTLNYGFEYPENWAVHNSSEFTISQGIERVDQFTNNEGSSIAIISKTNDWKSLEDVQSVYRGIRAPETIVNESIIEVNGTKGYAIVSTNDPMKTKEVILLARGKVYELSYNAMETQYDASLATFDHVLGSFNIK